MYEVWRLWDHCYTGVWNNKHIAHVGQKLRCDLLLAGVSSYDHLPEIQSPCLGNPR